MEEDDRARVLNFLRLLRGVMMAGLDLNTRPLLDRIVEADVQIPADINQMQLNEFLENHSREMRKFLCRPTPQTATYNSSTFETSV